ncbi:MAG TPA: diaminopimelate epimerase [Polyangiaceae bacterium]|nr:diaminopimelate epimerase [Polyangiaceae bacterium]
MKFWKAHGLGNDYLVLEAELSLDPALVSAICDRNRGIGSDGILEPCAPSLGADFGVRIWNPDGSVAEKSGNGLRIFARWLHSQRGAREAFTVSTDACKVGCHASSSAVSVEMGAPTFVAAEVPVLADGEFVEQAIALSDGALIATAVGIGNPHCVVFRSEPLDELPWRRWGAELERHALFPNRTNVQIARVVTRSQLEIRIHERGAGETQASGSSSCAAAAAGVRTGRLAPGRISVLMPGGELTVTVSATGILLEGPVEGVGHFELDPAWLAARRRR